MIALYRGKSMISKAIRWQTRSDYSHAAWVCPDFSVIEAWWPHGVRHVADPFLLHTEDTEIDLWAVSGLTAQQEREVERFLRLQLGKRYDMRGVFQFLSRRPCPQNERWFCSELVAAALDLAGAPLLHAAPHLLAPGHLPWSTRMHLVAARIDEAAWFERFGGRENKTRDLEMGF